MNANGARPHPLVPIDDTQRFSPRWSPDSRSIMYIEVAHGHNAQGIFGWISSRVVIQKHGVDERRFLKTSAKWVIHSVCYMDNGKQSLIAAEEYGAPDSQIEIYRYHLATNRITNLTNDPKDDYSIDWISDDVYSVTLSGKKKTLWGTVKK